MTLNPGSTFRAPAFSEVMEKVSHLFVIFYFTYVTIIVPSQQQSGGFLQRIQVMGITWMSQEDSKWLVTGL